MKQDVFRNQTQKKNYKTLKTLPKLSKATVHTY